MPKVYLQGQRPTPKTTVAVPAASEAKPAPEPTPSGDAAGAAAKAPNASAAPSPASEQAKPPSDHADAFASLSRKENELRLEREALKAERAQLDAERSKATPTAKEKPADITSYLADGGFTYDQIVEHYLKNPPDPNDRKFRDLKDEIIGRLDERDKREAKAREDAQKAADEKVAADYQREMQVRHDRAKTVVEKDTDGKYGLVKALGDVALGGVVPRIESRFFNDNVMLTPEQALEELEAATETEFFKIVNAKIPRIDAKLRELYGAPAAPPEPKPTLTHRTGAGGASRDPNQKLSAKELRQRMIDRINEGRRQAS